MTTHNATLPKLLAICADDFGQSQAISDAIAYLAQQRRINAVSCMTNAPYWKQSVSAAKEFPKTVGIGLHLNLTEGRPLSPELARIWPRLPTLPTLMARAHLGLIPQAAVSCEIRAQWAAFVQDTGAQPMYVDGHQHVHQFPGVRSALLATFDQLKVKPAVRNTAQLIGPGFAFKRWVIHHTGARQLRVQLQQRKLPHNTVLMGAYDFKSTNYRTLMQAWLAVLPSPGGLLFCHPGHAGTRFAADLIGLARQREFSYLASEDFTQDLASANVTLVRTWQ